MADDDRPVDGPASGGEPDDDSTRARGPDETAALPGGGPEPDDTAVEQPAASWSARAQVPTSGAGGADQGDGGPPDEQWPVAEPGGPWWLPVALAALALVVLGVLAAGIWLIADALREDPAPAPPTPPPATGSPTPSPTAQQPTEPTPEATPPQPTPEPTPTPGPTAEPTPTPAPTAAPTAAPSPTAGTELLPLPPIGD